MPKEWISFLVWKMKSIQLTRERSIWVKVDRLDWGFRFGQQLRTYRLGRCSSATATALYTVSGTRDCIPVSRAHRPLHIPPAFMKLL